MNIQLGQQGHAQAIKRGAPGGVTVARNAIRILKFVGQTHSRDSQPIDFGV